MWNYDLSLLQDLAGLSEVVITAQVWDIGVLLEDLEDKNHEVIWKVANEAFAVSRDLDTHVDELVMKSYAPPGSRVLSEDQLQGCANSIKKTNTLTCSIERATPPNKADEVLRQLRLCLLAHAHETHSTCFAE